MEKQNCKAIHNIFVPVLPRFVSCLHVDGTVPVKSLFEKTSLDNDVMSPISDGKVPLYEFSPISKNVATCKFPNCVGIVPFISFLDKARLSMSISEPSSVGSVPVTELEKKSRNSKPVNSPISVGIDPVKRLESATIFITDVGRDRIRSCAAPVNLLSPKTRVARALRFPVNGGNVPSRMLPSSQQLIRFGNNPSDDGTVPVRKLDVTNNSVNDTWSAKSGKVPVKRFCLFKKGKKKEKHKTNRRGWEMRGIYKC